MLSTGHFVLNSISRVDLFNGDQERRKTSSSLRQLNGRVSFAPRAAWHQVWGPSLKHRVYTCECRAGIGKWGTVWNSVPGALLMYKKYREEWHHLCIPVNKTAWASFNHNNFFQILGREIHFVSQSSSQHNIHSFFYLFFYPLSPLLCIRSHLVTCCSVAQLCPTLCNPMDCSTPAFLVLHYFPELAQTDVH